MLFGIHCHAILSFIAANFKCLKHFERRGVLGGNGSRSLSEGKRNDSRQRGGKNKMHLPRNVVVQIMRIARVYDTPAPMKLILLVQQRCKTKHGFGALGLAM